MHLILSGSTVYYVQSTLAFWTPRYYGHPLLWTKSSPPPGESYRGLTENDHPATADSRYYRLQTTSRGCPLYNEFVEALIPPAFGPENRELDTPWSEHLVNIHTTRFICDNMSCHAARLNIMSKRKYARMRKYNIYSWVLHSSVVRASNRHLEGHGLDSHWGAQNFFLSISTWEYFFIYSLYPSHPFHLMEKNFVAVCGVTLSNDSSLNGATKLWLTSCRKNYLV